VKIRALLTSAGYRSDKAYIRSRTSRKGNGEPTTSKKTPKTREQITN
jgi:hypothetical protein